MNPAFQRLPTIQATMSLSPRVDKLIGCLKMISKAFPGVILVYLRFLEFFIILIKLHHAMEAAVTPINIQHICTLYLPHSLQ